MKICKILSILPLLFMLSAQTAMASNVVVKDGDSLEIGERRIRLDGIDAPEFTQICEDASGKEYECGKEALYFLENWLNDKDVNCDCLPETDRYGREICECFVDGVSINAELVKAGHAVAYRDDKYLPQEANAEQNKRGIWQGKHMRPALYRVLNRYERKAKTAH